MPIYFDKAKQRWRFTFNRVVKRRRRRATKLLPAGYSRAQADAYDRAESARLYAQALGQDKPLGGTIAGAVQLYVEHRVPEIRGGLRLALELKHLSATIKGEPLERTAEAAANYAKAERDRLAPATIRNRLAYLKAAVRYAWRKHNYGDQNHAARVVLPTVANERQVYLKMPEVRQLLEAIEDKETRAVFTLAFWTGSRWVSEILPRTQEDIERQGRQVWLRVGYTKNGSPRMVPVHPEALWTLAHLPFGHNERTYRREYERTRARLELEHVRAHDFRHSLASEIISRGGTLADVGAALHHKSVQSSQRYSHLYPERLRQVLMGVGRGKKRKAA